MELPPFAVTWDYRCPFARNAHEFLVAALKDGAPFDVEFVPFTLTQGHLDDGAVPVWDDPARGADLLALETGVVVRDHFADRFLDVHGALFSARHDEGADLRRRDVVAGVLEACGVSSEKVFAEIGDGWARQEIRRAYERCVGTYEVFGVPTFIAEDRAAFVRLMTSPATDPQDPAALIERLVTMLIGQPELNEFKHTTLSR
jgi:hypothetical protein